MTYEERIRGERPDMSKSFAKLADFLLDSYVEAAFMTASELAHALNLDAATVVRFSQHLGYDGFPKLQREIRQRVKDDLLIRDAVNHELHVSSQGSASTRSSRLRGSCGSPRHGRASASAASTRTTASYFLLAEPGLAASTARLVTMP